jgi:hypothetical protein
MTDRSLPPARAVIGSVKAAHRALNDAAILREDAKQYPHLPTARPMPH